MSDVFVYELVANVEKYVSGMSKAKAESLELDRNHDLLAKHGVKLTERFREELVEVESLTKAFHGDSIAATQLAARKQLLIDQMEKLSGVTGKNTQMTSASGRVFLGMGRILEGSAISLRQVANDALPLVRNLGLVRQQAQMAGTTIGSVLLSSLAGPGGIALAMGAASAATVFFGDDIVDAFSKGKREAEEAKKVYDQALDSVLKFERQRGGITFDDAELSERIETDMMDLGSLLQEERLLNKDIVDATDELNRLRLLGIDMGPEVEAQREIIRLSTEGLRLNKTAISKTEDRLALAREQFALMEEELALQHEIIETHDEQLDEENERTDNQKKRLSLIEKEIKEQEQLKSQLRDLASGGAQRLAIIEQQNKRLQEQIALQRSMGLAQAGFLTMEARDQAPTGRPGSGATPGQLDLASPWGVQTFTDSQISYYQKLQDAHREAIQNMEIDWASYFTKVGPGLDMLHLASQMTFGGFADLSATAFELSGQHARGYFALYKTFAIAEAAVNTYVGATKVLAQGGIFGPAMAAGVIASGLAMVARIAATSPGSSSGGSVSGPRGSSIGSGVGVGSTTVGGQGVPYTGFFGRETEVVVTLDTPRGFQSQLTGQANSRSIRLGTKTRWG